MPWWWWYDYGYNQRQRDRQNHDQKMLNARNEAERKKRESENAHRQTMERMRNAERDRQERMAEAARQRRAQEKAEAEQRKNAQAKAMEQMRQEAAEKERKAKEDQQRRDHEHQQKVKAMEDQRKKEEEAHRKKMREMIINAKKAEVKDKKQQRDNAVKQMRDSVKVVDQQIKDDQKELKELKATYKEAQEKLANLNVTINTFDKDNDDKYKQCKDDMETALKVFQRDDDEIWKAIEKTGQREDGVGRFLKLTHQLIGETMASQDNANKLDAELHTFSTLISRECQDKLTIEYLFNDKKLDRFVPILAKQNYTECQELVCQDEEEFKEEIQEYVESEIDKQIEEWKKRNPDEEDPFETFLAHYKLSKYKRALANMEIDSLEAVADEDLDDETVKEIISEVGIKGLAKKKFKKAVKEVQTGKYTPPPKENDDNKDEEKGDPWDSFLEKYQLQKYKEELTKAGLDGFDAIGDLDKKEKKPEEKEEEENPEIAKIMKAAGIEGLFEKKFKRAIDDFKTGKYKEEEKEEKKEDPKPLPISMKEVRILKNICLKPDDKKVGWKVFENEKSTLTKLALIQMGPVFGGFFSRMNDVAKQAQKLLSYSQTLNDEQNKAMSILMETTASRAPKAITGPESKMDDDEKSPDEIGDTMDPERLPDYAQRKGWKTASECQVFSKEKGRWYDGTIKEITNDKEGEWLTIEYSTDKHLKSKQVDRYGPDVRDPVMVECRAISAAITVDINITDMMMDEFSVSQTTLRVLPVARGVEQSTKAILLCQSQIRQSVRLAGQILKLKPANLTDTAKPLWNAVDAGIINIIEGALEMSQIAAQYFGFFLRFNQSFQRFISMNEQSKDVTLFTSLEHIKQDINEFSAFKKEFNEKVQRLSNQAMQVIKNCVATHIGVEQFESTRAAREQAKNDYLDKKQKYVVESLRLDGELKILKDNKARDLGQEAALKSRIDQLTQRTKDNEEFKKTWLKEIDELMKKNFDSEGALNKIAAGK